MDCSRWRESASDYIEGILPPASAKAMQTHAETCASCKSDENALRSLCRELNVLPTVDPPLFFADNVMAALERDRARGLFAPQNGLPSGPWWQTMLPQLGRVAFGTALTGGAVVALVWTLLLPGGGKSLTENAPQVARLPAAVALPDFLPGGENPEGDAPAPNLRIARVTTMVPSSGPAFDLALWMENADGGTARFNLLGDKTPYRFHLGGVTAPQTLRVPFSAALDKTVGLQVYWTANASHHTRYLFVPIPPQVRSDGASNSADTAIVPSVRQSFGLPEQSLLDAARDVSARYNVPVTLDDVPETLRVQITARDETAPETLTRQLKPLGLRVSSVKGGLLIETIAPAATGEASTAATPPPSAP